MVAAVGCGCCRLAVTAAHPATSDAEEAGGSEREAERERGMGLLQGRMGVESWVDIGHLSAAAHRLSITWKGCQQRRALAGTT